MPSDGTPLRRSRLVVARRAVLSRVAVLSAMALSNAAMPTFDPGDDVPRFDLRLTDPGADRRFCLEGHACAGLNRPRSSPPTAARRTGSGRRGGAGADADAPTGGGSSARARARRRRLDALYAAVLEPLTRWDAARFLGLAADPSSRRPPMRPKKRWWNGGPKPPSGKDDVRSSASERAHAFLPLWPILIRYTAAALLFAPASVLPGTFEGVAALAALLLNLVCFVAAALLLHDLTYTILGYCSPSRPAARERLYMAESAATLFCFNPAGVFFSSAYSESTFAMLTFGGHALAARGKFLAATVPWMLASYTRSNGTFAAVWFLIVGCESVAADVVDWVASGSDLMRDKVGVVVRCLGVAFEHLALAILVAIPIVYHDQRGYDLHCLAEDPFLRPSWCPPLDEGKGSFSLYAHVQRKYWNVGPFRYYQLKQIPNFILAAPVLILSASAMNNWIRFSFAQYRGNKAQAEGTARRWFRDDLLMWCAVALSSSDLLRVSGDGATEPKEEKRGPSGYRSCTKVDPTKIAVLLGPSMLSHYAVLAGFCILGAIVVHVQVSTRLICSSCPAFYWYVAYVVLRGEFHRRWKRKAVMVYFGVFNVLGALMHANFLPWT